MKFTLEDIQARWPLFKFEPKVNSYTGDAGFRVWLEPWKDNNGSSSMHISDTPGDNVVETLDRYHQRITLRNRYLERYPNLWFYIGQERLRVEDVWVRRDERDGEGFSVYGDAVRDPIMLEYMDSEAKKAVQDGWFLCTRCNKAKPKTEYGYFYFAGKYCKICKESDPAHYRRAMNESYN